MMSPLGKCLETALEELLEEDNGFDPRDTPLTAEDESESNHHKTPIRNSLNESYEFSPKSNNGQLNQKNDIVPESTSPTRRDKQTMLFDGAMSKSILDVYCKAVVETNFDDETNQSCTESSHTGTATSIKSDALVAPAAMLMGEIDHYNRVGGQWRIVVKNALIKRRAITQIDNGKTGRSLRKRMVLNWNDDGYDNDCDARHAIRDTDRAPHASSDVHHFPGTIQILAYDDDS
jgi:hypothetical protein